MKQQKNLTELRLKIDKLDREVATLLGQRFELVGQILQEKINFDLPIQDAQREKEILEALATLASGAYVDELLVIFRVILKVSCQHMKEKIHDTQGFSITKKTIPIKSSVGTSLMKRQAFSLRKKSRR